MTQPEARHVIHSAAQLREAVETVAKERTEAVLLQWSNLVDQVMKHEKVGTADIAARGGPAKRTVDLMLKVSNPRLSTMVEFVTALGSTEHEYELQLVIVKKEKRPPDQP